MSASWAQDVTIPFSKDWGSNTKKVDGLTVDIANNNWDNLESFINYIVLSKDGAINISGKNIKYIRITFGDENTTYNLKWGGAWDANVNADNEISGKGSVILKSNSCPTNFKIINDVAKGTTSTSISRVDVFYKQDGLDYNTDNQTEANATKKVSGITCENNIIPLDKVNVIGQYCSFSSTKGYGIMMNTSGDHYLSIKFENEIDLHELVGFTIEGDNVSSVVDHIGFLYDDNDKTKEFGKWTNPTSISSFTSEQSTNLTHAKEIRIYNESKEGSFKINSIKLTFGGSHARVTPTLASPTQAEMVINEGDDLILKITNDAGYWREYSNAEHTGGEIGTRISTTDWIPYAYFDGGSDRGHYAKLPEGHYYFGIKDGGKCNFEVQHYSPEVAVHVKVNSSTSVTLNDPVEQTITLDQTVHLRATSVNAKQTEVHLFADAALTNELCFVNWRSDYEFSPSEGVKRGDSNGGAQGAVVKSGAGVYYLAFRAAKPGDDWRFTEYEVYKITVVDRNATVSADLSNRGHGGNATMENGVLTTKGSSDNWANIFVFPSSTNENKNVEVSADNYAGFTITANGGAFRIIIYYNDENGANKQKEVAASVSNVENRYFWSDFGLNNTEVKNIRRIAVAGVGYQDAETINFSNTKLINLPVGVPNGYRAIHVTHDGQTKEREFIVHVPTGASGAVPVLFSLHGEGGHYTHDVQNYDGTADDNKFIVVYPQGLEGRVNGQRGWLSTGKYNEDVKFFEDIIEWLDKNYLIDRNRIYMTGYRNGAAMTYSTAFTTDRFAGFAAVNGYPKEDFHLQHYGNGAWQGSHPVPFLHIQQNNEYRECMPTIIDNMVYRNGCNPIAEKTVINATETWASNATKYYYSDNTGMCPFVYYDVEVEGSYPQTTFQEPNGGPLSVGIIWNFLKDKTRPNMSDYAGRNRVEFQPGLGTAEFEPLNHGWKQDLNNNILWQYGDSKTEALDGASGHHTSNVYHTIQLGSGFHNFKFKSSSSMGNTSTMWVTVRVEKLGKLGASGNTSTYTAIDKVVYEKDFNIGEVSFNINQEESEICEYRLTFEWHNSDETARGIAAGKGIQISGVSILNNTGVDMGQPHNETHKQDFGGYFDFENRLIAQWNFDLCDGARFNRQSLSSNWVADDASIQNGVITYTYNAALNNEQLTYGNSANTLIPIAAGLKFKADAGQVKVQAYVENGNLVRSQLVLEPGVQMYVPYVHNSYRNDKLNNGSAVKNAPDDNQFKDYMDCLHHINRDILYVSSSPDFFAAIVNENYYDGTNGKPKYENNSVDTQNDFLFISGGAGERVKGAKVSLPEWEKLNYCGKQGDDCWVTIKQQVTIDRLAVNRNLVTSFYTENISIDTDQSRPYPGMRYIGSPQGNKVADAQTFTTYDKAIAMTFGGWEYNYNEFKDGSDKGVTDSWSELNVYHGSVLGEGNQNYNIGAIDVTKVPLATDGFPVYSSNTNRAYSETVNPNPVDWNFDNDALSYHDQNYGNFYLSTGDGGSYNYVENLTPWSLPCRGGYIKFEPTYPGVLNVHILQEANQVYYIADEFGKLVKNVFVKTGTEQTVSGINNVGTAGHYSIAQKDNVKYVFDVYPGKSYYIFSNTAAGMGFTGFYFEPYVYRKYNTLADAQSAGYSGDKAKEAYELGRQDIGIKTADLNAVEGYTGPSSMTWNEAIQSYSNQTASLSAENAKERAEIAKTENADYVSKYSNKDYYQSIQYSNKAVHVRYNRSFEANTWSTICLPYSLNHLQLQDIFGDDVKVILLRDVQELGKNGYDVTTVNFIYHQNQDIIAGYPYLIYPSKTAWSVTANVMIPETLPSLVTINGVGQNTVTHPGNYDYTSTPAYNYDGLHCYDFKGNFVPEPLPKGSYVIATDGKLTRLPQDQTAAPFRAFLKYDQSKEKDGLYHAKDRLIEAVNYGIDLNEEEDATNIEDILLQSGIVGAKTDVYSINGTMVRQNTDDLRNLPKGMYIVNGKKYLVK